MKKIYAAINDIGRIIATNDEPFEIQPEEQLITYIPERNYPTQETPGAFGYVVRDMHLLETESTVVHGSKKKCAADGIGAEPLYKDYGHFDAWKMVLEELQGAPKPAYEHGLNGIEETRRQLQHLIALAQDGVKAQEVRGILHGASCWEQEGTKMDRIYRAKRALGMDK